MSLPIAKNEQSFARPRTISDADKSIKVLIPYDGSQSAEMALDDLRRAGLPQALEAMVAVTNVWLPLSPNEITRTVSARRLKVLTAGASSFAPALRDHEEQRVLSLEAEGRISSIFPSGTVRVEGMQDSATVANEILRKAKQWGAELIIVGSNISPSPHITGYAGPAITVAREAHCSVRIARASDRRDESSIRVMIAAHTSQSAAQIVQAVADRSWPEGTKAGIVAVNSGPHDPKKDSANAAQLEQFAEKLRAIGLKVSTAIRHGRAQDVLLQEARAFSADCIFIDSHGVDQGVDDRLDGRGLGQVAEALVLGAHCSVEVVRAKNVSDQHFEQVA